MTAIGATMIDADHSSTAVSGPDANATPAMPSAPALSSGMERRRPGRRSHVDPALIPLLRRTPDTDAQLPLFDFEEDQMEDRAPSRGIFIGVAVSALLWVCGIAAVGSLLF